MEQLSLFSEEIKRNPRPANIPAVPKTKDTQASYSVWGWLFQITAAIVLGLKYRKNLTKIKVEGKILNCILVIEIQYMFKQNQLENPLKAIIMSLIIVRQQ